MLSKSRFETIAMLMICSLMEHGFLPVFSVVGKIMLYSVPVSYTIRPVLVVSVSYKLHMYKTLHTRISPDVKPIAASFG